MRCQRRGAVVHRRQPRRPRRTRRTQHDHIPVDVAEHVTYLPRATHLYLGGRTFGFLGGAFSVDWRDRTAGIDWWHHEVTDTDDVARLGTEQLDVLMTHDAPAGVDLLSSWKLPAEDQVRADDVRALVAQATAHTSPRLVVHGHWHQQRRIRLHDLRHTHATILLKAGVPAKVVSERLGHSSPAFTITVTSTSCQACKPDAAAAFSAAVCGV